VTGLWGVFVARRERRQPQQLCDCPLLDRGYEPRALASPACGYTVDMFITGRLPLRLLWVHGYEGKLVFHVTETDLAGNLTSAAFSSPTRFKRFEGRTKQSDEGLLLQEPGLQIRATFLDHGEAVLAFALEERAHISVRRNKVEAMGLAIGPWLRAFKESTIRGAPRFGVGSLAHLLKNRFCIGEVMGRCIAASTSRSSAATCSMPCRPSAPRRIKVTRHGAARLNLYGSSV